MLEILYNIYQKIAYGDINYAIFLLNYLICAISGFAIIFFNSFYGFTYFRDKFHIYLGILLPIIGYTITLIIGSNIALSLGMIGALSIIRFRTPVRSSYELVIYFLLLTIGITASVDTMVTIILTIASLLILALLSIIFKKNILEFSGKKNLETSKITLSFSLKNNNQNMNELISENKSINVSIKKDGNFYLISGTIEFLNISRLENFIKKNEEKLLSYEIYKN